jgi:PAS domain S-box-containing protein
VTRAERLHAGVRNLDGHHRLEQLYEVSKLFAAFASVDETVGKALQVVAATLPLESAFLIQATIGCHTEITVWQSEGSTPARLLAARAHAEVAYAYLVGARSVDTLDLRDRIGSAALPAPRSRSVPSEHTRRFIVIPLVVGRGMVFGALQFEAASVLDRNDVEFVNALANQLSIALDRDRRRRHDVVRRREAQLSQARYESIVDRLDSAFVWEADLETRRISYVSAQFEQMLGFSRRQCLDERNWWRSHVHPDDHRLLEQTFERALAERGEQRCDLRVITSDKAIRWLHTSMHLADVPGEAPRFQGLSCDITVAKTDDGERDAREVALAEQLARRGALAIEHARLYDEARRAVELRDQALATVSDEMKSLLTTIMMASKILGEGEPAGDGRWTKSIAIAKIQHATDRMERLVDDLRAR